MKKITVLFLLCLCCKVLFAQKKQIRESYTQKFYKDKNLIYGITHPKNNPEAHLLSLNIKGNTIKQVFPYSHFGLISTYYNNLIYDVNVKYLILLTKSGREIEIGSQLLNLDFFPQNEPTEAEWAKKPIDENTLSHNLTGIQDFYYKRALGSRKDYWHYDMILKKDETLLMPVAYKDSLYFYTFTDKAWTKPDYQGVEKNKENDKWTRTSQAKHDFKTGFRAFQIKDDTYFLTNADTMIYKYENKALKEIGRIKPIQAERTLFLIDKDDDKVYFLMCENIDVIPEERKRFVLLRKEDELYKAIKRIIDEPYRK
jgi:hypothetical protein